MIVLKYVDLFLIILISTYIGFLKANSFSKRILELKNMKNALNMFKTKIEFTYEPIKEIFLEISRIIYQDNNNIFKIFCEKIDSKEITIAWNEAVLEYKGSLNDNDKDIIKMLGKMLGKTDKNGQISEIELVSNFLDKQINDAEDMKIKNEKLYKTLGVIGGLTVAIVLI